jgi:type II secretion system protein J
MPGAQEAGLARVDWRLEDGRLSRRLWPTLIPANAEAAGPFRPVLEDVRGLRVFTWSGSGWIEGWSPPPDAGPDLLPPALRVVVESARWGRLELTESYR